MRFIGIDPGESGGIAVLDRRGTVIFACPTPESNAEVLQLLTFNDHNTFAVLEHVWSSPGWGHVGAFTFGKSLGRLQMALAACTIDHALVTPQKWQREMNLVYPKKASKTVKKNISKARAVELFPDYRRITHAIADALLLAEYAHRYHVKALAGVVR